MNRRTGEAAKGRPGARAIRLAITLLFFTAAPTAGDIGSSCQPEDDLDPPRFWGAKQALDCQRCDECQLTSMACSRACSAGLIFTEFPAGCGPVVHDGEVCLDALAIASCTDYAAFMADEGSTIPIECDFCPLRAPASAADAGGE